jgi:hypothetical protein
MIEVNTTSLYKDRKINKLICSSSLSGSTTIWVSLESWRETIASGHKNVKQFIYICVGVVDYEHEPASTHFAWWASVVIVRTTN